MKRLMDVFFSFVGLIVLLPLFFLISVAIVFDSGFPVFYLQKRVGKNGKDFILFKFRTMKLNSDEHGLLTVGKKDSRITRIGYFLRAFKLDELPQLLNVFIGDMSLVGPRPEVRKYVTLYNEEQRRVLSVRPGITDYASIKYVNENDLLADAKDPEEFYIKRIMPEKLKLNMEYIHQRNLLIDIKIILQTFRKIFN